MMNGLKIEKAVPLPASDGRGAKRKYPWDEMKIGDSFVASDVRSTSALVNTRVTAERRTGFKFITRKVENGVRVWRVY